MTKTKALDRGDRQEQIVLWFQIRLEKGLDTYCSLNQIAKALQLAPSTKLRKMTDELLGTRLESEVLKRQGRWPGKGYRLMRGTFELPKKKERAIVINSRAGSQLELWS